MTMFNNIGPDYEEVVIALAVWQIFMTFEELMEVMTTHQIQLRMRQSTTSIIVNLTRMTMDVGIDSSSGGSSGVCLVNFKRYGVDK